MKPGAVIVDVAVDQGGCIETIHETTHTAPVYDLHGVLHCGRQHAGGRAAHLNLRAHQRHLALHPGRGDQGCRRGDRRRPGLALGLNTASGAVTNGPVAQFLGVETVEPAVALAP
ncbi:MAG: hypothetical protein R2705_15860 [Ilumatobacteraceae bacterium]